MNRIGPAGVAVGGILLAVCAIAPRACEAAMKEYVETRECMGTFVTIRLFAEGEETANGGLERAFKEIEQVNAVMSTHIEESELSRLNREADGTLRKVSPELFHVIERAFAMSELTEGAFDVTVRPSLELWREAAKRGAPPSAEEIAEALTFVGYGKVKLASEEHAVALPTGMSIDLGGIAKGYAVDLASEALRKAGITSFLINAGGDLFAEGLRADGRPWRIYIQDPWSEKEVKTLRRIVLVGRSAATSGHYYRFTEIAGHRYSHIVDPRTGMPVEGVAASATAIGLNALETDALATALCVLGGKKAEEVVERVNGEEGSQAAAAFIITGSREKHTFTATRTFAQYEARESPRRGLVLFGLAGLLVHTVFVVRRRRSNAECGMRSAELGRRKGIGEVVWMVAPYVVFGALVVLGMW
ncbi:MAG: FAD:protein FMN transferase [Planctomycetota bacterium]